MQMEKLLNHCDMELMKMAMLKHEETFRQQVRVYASRALNTPQSFLPNNNFAQFACTKKGPRVAPAAPRPEAAGERRAEGLATVAQAPAATAGPSPPRRRVHQWRGCGPRDATVLQGRRAAGAHAGGRRPEEAAGRRLGVVGLRRREESVVQRIAIPDGGGQTAAAGAIGWLVHQNMMFFSILGLMPMLLCRESLGTKRMQLVKSVAW
jgi:hypothetical protein